MTSTADSTVRPIDLGGPYVGLRAFSESHAEFFFGRDADRKQIIGNLRVARLTLLYAQSGVGKSSVLRAGVIPRLRELADDSLASGGMGLEVPVLFGAWSSDPVPRLIDEIAAAVQPLVAGRLDTTGTTLETVIESATDAADVDLLVILDQFEEYFTNRPLEAGPQSFADQLAACIDRSDLRVRFLIAIREDAYAGVGEVLKTRATNVYGNFLHLDYLDAEDAKEAIGKPIDRWNELHPDDPPFTIEPELVDAVVRQVRLGVVSVGDDRPRDQISLVDDETRVETTYLQLVMKRLWEEEVAAGSRALRLATLEQLGGARQIIGSHLDDAMAQLATDRQEVAAAMFGILVTRTGMKIALSASDLADILRRPEAELTPTLRDLASGDVHILRSVVVPDDPQRPRYEIYHDTLAQPIREWRARHLRSQEEAEQRAELAHREAELEQARALARRERQRRIALSGIAILLVVLLVASFLFWRQARDEQRRSAALAIRQESAALAARSLSSDADPQQSVSDAKAALDKNVNAESLVAARAAMTRPYVTTTLRQDIGDPAQAQIVTTPDGKLTAFGGEGGAWLWNQQGASTPSEFRADGKPAFGVSSPGGRVVAFHFTADGKKVLVVGTTAARLFDVDAAGTPTASGRGFVQQNRTDPLLGGAVSPDGQRMLVLSLGRKTLDVLDPDGATTAQSGTETESAVVAADWTTLGDGRLMLVTLTDHQLLSVWNDDGTSFSEARAPLPYTSTYRISPDGSKLAIGTTGVIDQPSFTVDDLSGGSPERYFTTPGVNITELVFNRQGDGSSDRIAGVESQGVVRVCGLGSAATCTRSVPLHVSREFTTSLGTPPESVALAEAPFAFTNNAGSVTVWDSQDGVAVDHFDVTGRVFDVQPGDHGQYTFLQVSWAPRSATDPVRVGRLRRWTGQSAYSGGDLGADVELAQLSHDGHHLIVASEPREADLVIEVRDKESPGTKTVQVRPLADAIPEGQTVGPKLEVWFDFAEEGRRLVTVASAMGGPTAGFPNSVQVWDLPEAAGGATDPPKRILSDQQNPFPMGSVRAIDMASDGRFVYVSGRDVENDKGYTQRFRTDGTAPPETLVETPGGDHTAVAVSNDGKYFAVGESNGLTVVGDAAHPETGLRVLRNGSGTTPAVTALAFSEQGQLIATGSADGTVLVRDRASGKVRRRFALGSGVTSIGFAPKSDYLVAKGQATPTRVLALGPAEGANAVMLVDPIPEAAHEVAIFEPAASGSTVPSVLSTEGDYLVRYPCQACVSTTEMRRLLEERVRQRSHNRQS